MDNRKFNQDEYLELSKYNGHPKSKENPKFSIFSHDGGYFFAMLNHDGKAFLRSEGYSNEKTRDTGMNSVMNNSSNKDRWSVVEESGKSFLVLKAANHKEIGRSGAFNSKADAESSLNSFFNPNQKSASKDHSLDEYLPIKKYRGHKMSSKYKGFCTFTENGEYYFGMADDKGKVRLRSQGYKSEAARDNGIESVIKNRDVEKRWAVIEENGSYFGILKAGNHQEIGRSEAYKDKAAAAWTPLLGAAGTATAAGLVSNAEKETTDTVKDSKAMNKNVLKEEELEDDYLPTKYYEGHTVNDKRNNVAMFKHTDGQYYFALYNKDGSVKLRSEGFETAMNRDKELAGVLKFHTNEKMYTKLEKGKYYMMVLKDEKGNEVGRSPLLKTAAAKTATEKKAVPTASKTVVKKTVVSEKNVTPIDMSKFKMPAKLISAAATTAFVTKYVTTTKVKPVSYETVSLAKAGDNMRVVRTVEGNMAGATEVARNVKMTEVIKYAPGPGYLKFAWLPLLFLLPFIWLTLGGEKTPPPPPPVVAKTPPPPPPVKQVVPPPVIPKCKCSDLSHPIFLLPEGPAPKTTTALGRAPEYGNQHKKSPLEFYQKLKREYKKSSQERTFLDGIFKQMGYKNGFKDADVSADLFTAVNVPRGVEGNLGTKTTHKTVYRKLDPIDAKDLKAFRIKSKNACDLHFMKTCGNHFFFEKCDESS